MNKTLKDVIEKRLNQLPTVNDIANESNPTLHVKLFAPWCEWCWYIAAFEPTPNLCYGYVIGLENAWGYFSIEELGKLQGPMHLGVECDKYFTPGPLNCLKLS